MLAKSANIRPIRVPFPHGYFSPNVFFRRSK